MTKRSHRVLPWLALASGFLAVLGCTPAPKDNSGPPPAAPGGLKQTMMQIGGKGPDALWPKINSGLNTNPPPWDDLKPPADTLADLAAKLGANEPPKGKETWDVDTKAFMDVTSALDAAVAAKDLDKAKDAQNKVHDACDTCHRAHRGRPGG